MKVYSGEQIRNVGVTGHGNTGKTQLTTALLHTAGATNRLTGAPVTDFDEEEIEREVSIWSALGHAEWTAPSQQDAVKINLIDTPGFNLFINDTRAALVAADSSLILVDAVSGPEVVTEKVWDFAVEYELPRIFVVSRMDRENANFGQAVSGLQERFGREVIPIALPIGQAKDFTGLVDLIGMKAWTYKSDGNGKAEVGDIPQELADAAKAAHEALVEMVAEGDDAMMEKFFEAGTLPEEDLRQGLLTELKAHKIHPVVPGSGLHNIGSDYLLNVISTYLPNPTTRGEVTGYQEAGKKEGEITRKIAGGEPVSVFVWKTMADPFAGRISYFKVMSGTLKNDAHLANYTSESQERFAHISVAQGKNTSEVPELHAGDLGVVAKLKDTQTGHSLGEKGQAIHYPPVSIPEPLISFAIEPKSRQDEEKMSPALHKILEENPSLSYTREAQTGDFLLGGSGQQQIEVIVSKLKKRYGVEVALKAPKIPYRETIRGRADVEGKHKKQSGGRGQFGVARIKMEPLPRGSGYEFVNDIFGGSIPKNWIPSVDKGIQATAAKGFLAGFPVTDFKIILYDGKYHDVDSSDAAFQIAGSLAFKGAMRNAKPALLEPIMQVEIYVPSEYSGDLMGDVSGRRGKIQGMDTRGAMTVIKAEMPMAEMLEFANSLTALTQGRGSYHMEFGKYDFLPRDLEQKIIAKSKRPGAEAEAAG